MNLGELFIELGVVGDVKPLKEALKTMRQAQTVANRDLKLNKLKLKLIKDVSNATSKQQKSLIASNYVAERRNLLQEEDIEHTQDAIKGKENLARSIGSAITKLTAFSAAVIGTITIIDRMINSLLKANQAYVNFNRQTGLSIDNLNKYASAGALVDFNLSPQSVANSIQSLESNLAQIRLGQGNIMPFQLLGINPVGQDAFGVLEQLRNSIQGISDIDATNIIQQMGLSPEFISILRLSREEFEQLQDEVFLNSASRQAMNQYSRDLRKVQLQFALLRDKALVKILPLFVKLMERLEESVEIWARLTSNILKFVDASEKMQIVLKGIGKVLLSIMALFSSLYLILEDIAVYFIGGESVTGLAIEGLQKFGERLRESLSSLNFKDNGLIDFFKSLSQMAVPLPIQATIHMCELLLKLKGNGTNLLSSNVNATNIPSPVPLNRVNNTDNRAFNQTNNVNITTNQPVAQTVGNEIISYANVIDQIPAFG